MGVEAEGREVRGVEPISWSPLPGNVFLDYFEGESHAGDARQKSKLLCKKVQGVYSLVVVAAMRTLLREKNSTDHAVITFSALYRLRALRVLSLRQHDLSAASFFLQGFAGSPEDHHSRPKEDLCCLPGQSHSQVYAAGESGQLRSPGS